MSDLECPYCKSPLTVNHDDGKGYGENEIHQMQCNKCEKYFTFTTTIVFYYESEKADCLNEDNCHIWGKTHTFPREYTKMKCTQCGEERELTKDEMLKQEVQ